MIHWLKSLDRILRGELTKPEAVKDGSIDLPVRGLLFVIIILAMIYGACMGTFAIFREVTADGASESDRFLQILASTVKVPALFLLTLTVTFPSLYVFNAILGCRLNLISMLRLLVASLAVNLAVLSSLGPITAFFSVSTTSYRFMQLFNVAIFGVSGILGLSFLNQTLNRMAGQQRKKAFQERQAQIKEILSSPDDSKGLEQSEPPNVIGSESDEPIEAELAKADKPSDEPTESIGALQRASGIEPEADVRIVFRIWIVAFGLVGAQMGWVLRPFIGNPDTPFTWFRARQSNFFEAILVILGKFFGA